jgi:hypothetical protein
VKQNVSPYAPKWWQKGEGEKEITCAFGKSLSSYKFASAIKRTHTHIHKKLFKFFKIEREAFGICMNLKSEAGL